MTKKTIFFDIDGTLLGIGENHQLVFPKSAQQSLEQLKKNGHQIAICSGRQGAFVEKTFGDLFDCVLSLNGTHIVYQGKSIYNRTFSIEEIKYFKNLFDKIGARYSFVGDKNGWCNHFTKEQIDHQNSLYSVPNYLKSEWNLEEITANIIDFIFDDEKQVERCKSILDDTMVLNRHGSALSADLSFKGSDKAKGIELFLEYTKTDIKDTFAFGDGSNDIEMLKTVGCGIAMGNALPEVKKVADYITTNLFDDGIYHALKHFELI